MTSLILMNGSVVFMSSIKITHGMPSNCQWEEIDDKNDALVSIFSAGASFRPDPYNSSIESWDLMVKAM